MTELNPEVGSTVALKKTNFDQLLSLLKEMGYETIGAHVQENTIVYSPILTMEELPRGFTSEQSGGHYRLVYSGHPRYFDITPGAPGWKQYLFPPRSELFTVKKNGKSWITEEVNTPAPTYAFIGVRPCELAAIQIQDRVSYATSGVIRSTACAARVLLSCRSIACTHAAPVFALLWTADQRRPVVMI